MTKLKAIRSRTKASTNSTGSDLSPLITELRTLIHSACHVVATTVNTLQVLTNFEIGRRIVEHEQKGSERAEYGELLIQTLAEQLTAEFGRGFSKRDLDYMRRFYLDYVDRLSRIVQKPSAKSPFTLSWSHYVLLLTIKNPEERSFYEIEATNEGWSVPVLKRQVAGAGGDVWS